MSRDPSGPSTTTILIADTSGSTQLGRCLKQLLKSGHPSTPLDVVVASDRSVNLPAAMGRRVRRVRLTAKPSTATLLPWAAEQANTVVIAPSNAIYRSGWLDAVTTRARTHSQVVSTAVGGAVGIHLVPAAVTDPRLPREPWDAASVFSLVNEGAGAPEVTVSAVMIVKNEQAILGTCLDAVIPFVDEVIVYDTGSTDDTKAVARSRGVVVVEGFWDDDFGAARNRALGHATGTWVLQVDADEIIVGDPADLRARLAFEAYDMVQVPLTSTTWEGDEGGHEIFPMRIIRRERCEWRGALHEYPAARPEITDFRGSSPDNAPVRIVHSGYHRDVLVERDKFTRNRELALRQLASTPPGDPRRAEAVSNVGRSLMWEGRIDEGIAVLEELKGIVGNAGAVVLAVRLAVEVSVDRGSFDDLDEWLDALTRHGEAPGNIEYFRARRALAQGDLAFAADAVARLRGQGGGKDLWGAPYDLAQTSLLEALLAHQRGETAVAVTSLLRTMEVSPRLVQLSLLLSMVDAAGGCWSDVARSIPDDVVGKSLRECGGLPPATALRWCEALHEARPDDARPVAAATVFAASASWQVALEWSLRAREIGLPGECALQRLAARQGSPVFDRCVAWALLGSVLQVQGAWDSLGSLLPHLPLADHHPLTELLTKLGVAIPQAAPAA